MHVANDNDDDRDDFGDDYDFEDIIMMLKILSWLFNQASI